ncbi:DNA replication and repair protein RecF [Halosquirtibacter laminarini]|uniref:DNA replication and repair protein RecF n=1 Tax=Halosquirtibacter laminarini TaxID=3374600 RepID=A0AC61NMC5_9BACT|nr:DNA replication and repair protein RecF [Prolixibacteraceae bacterium]
MYLKNLSVINYKNIGQVDLHLSHKFNCFIGKNGMGKTNILDTIYYLSFCKSYFSSSDKQNVMHDESFFMLQGTYQIGESQEVLSCGYKIGQKKKFKREDREYQKLSEHIGLFPLVLISPSDQNLIQGGSEARRKFMDGVISQYNKGFLHDLIAYNRTLLQRNQLLKQFASQRFFDEETLLVYDQQLIHYGGKIYTARANFIETFLPIFKKHYHFICNGQEQVDLIYKSALHKSSYEVLLKESRQKDLAMGYTTTGPHKDDLELKLDDYLMKKIGSQGQNKSYLISLKFAQFDFMKHLNKSTPILVLDDIFDKLDAERVEQIIDLVSKDDFGQIFISDTNREHIDQIFKKKGADYKIFQLDKGDVSELDQQL